MNAIPGAARTLTVPRAGVFYEEQLPPSAPFLHGWIRSAMIYTALHLSLMGGLRANQIRTNCLFVVR